MPQSGNQIGSGQPVLEKVGKGHPMLFAGLFQTGKSVAAFPPKLTPGTTADFSPFHILPDLPLTQIVVQRQPRILKNQ